MTKAVPSELDKVKYQPYDYEIFVAEQAYKNAMYYKTIKCKLGICSLTHITKATRKRKVPPAKIQPLLQRE